MKNLISFNADMPAWFYKDGSTKPPIAETGTYTLKKHHKYNYWYIVIEAKK